VPISEEVETALNKLGITIRNDSWIFDYGLAEIPTEALCDLADFDFVTGVFIPRDN